MSHPVTSKADKMLDSLVDSFLFKSLLYVLASPFIGGAMFAAFIVLVLVGSWALYGVVFWITVFFWVASLFMDFTIWTTNPPMIALFPSMMAGLACHMATLKLAADKVIPSDPLLV